MKFIKDMVQGPDGKYSSIRVMSFIALAMAMFLTIFATVQNKPIDYNALIIWIVGAFCPKMIQRFAEGKKNP